MALLLGIDIGSSALKAAMIDEESGLCLIRTVAYDEDWIGEKPDYLERNIETYWEATKKCLKLFLEQDKIDVQKIKAVSFSTQGETFVPMDESFRPLRKTIQGHDVRAQEEAEILRSEFGDHEMYPVSGQPTIDAYWPAVKILWIKRNQPEVFAKTRRYVMIEDYIIHKLTGKFVTEKSLIGTSYYYDIEHQQWYLPMMEFLGITNEMLPEVMNPAEVVGEVKPEASVETGLSTDTLVVTGAMDQIAGGVGAGNVAPEIITETTGTSLAIGVTGRGNLKDYFSTGLPICFHAVKGAYFLMPWEGSGGLTFQWFAREFAALEKLQAEQDNKDPYDILTTFAARVPAGCEGLIMLPYLIGTVGPEPNPNARGVYFGISINHTKAHFVRAILEAIGYVIRANTEVIRKCGIQVSEIRSMGGGSKSRLWNQINADICKIPVSTMEISDTAALGAALLAGVGSGVYKQVEATCQSRFLKTKETFVPDSGRTKVYDECYRKYRSLYQHLKEIF